jgi:hypothetical protein
MVSWSRTGYSFLLRTHLCRKEQGKKEWNEEKARKGKQNIKECAKQGYKSGKGT